MTPEHPERVSTPDEAHRPVRNDRRVLPRGPRDSRTQSTAEHREQRPRHHVGRCACGKRRLPSKQAAKKVVFEARVARVVRKNRRRREDRLYECRYGAWHTTSQPRVTATSR